MIVMFCGGCAVDSHAIRDDTHEQELLSTSADLFWDGIRWGDAEKAASFIEPESRALFQVRLEEKLERRRKE